VDTALRGVMPLDDKNVGRHYENRRRSSGGAVGLRNDKTAGGGMRKRSQETHSQNSTVAANSINRYKVYCEHKMCK
jgi:hypothetical protein